MRARIASPSCRIPSRLCLRAACRNEGASRAPRPHGSSAGDVPRHAEPAEAASRAGARGGHARRPDLQLVFAGNDMGEERATRRAVRQGGSSRALGSRGCSPGPHATRRWRTPTCLSTRPTARCSAWCRSRPSRWARRSSSRRQRLRRDHRRPRRRPAGAAGQPGTARLGDRDHAPRSSAMACGGRARRWGGVDAFSPGRRSGDARSRLWRDRLAGCTRMTATGVTFVVPVHNGERCVGDALERSSPREQGRPSR